MKRGSFDYEGRDLEAMAHAPNYHAWIRDEFRSCLAGDVLEVGAGAGTFTQALLAASPMSLTAIEPSHDMHSLLVARHGGDARVRVHRATTSDLDGDAARFDAVVYNNVLEHIADDLAEMRRAHALLRPGGALLVFSPALPWLMSAFDRRVGHVRRYRRRELGERAALAGFQVERLHYVDLPGMVPWYLFMVLGGAMLNPRNVGSYDTFAVPVVRWLERLVRPPLGRNVLMVARRKE
ncbi:MAG TPA: class I SAM-dependent methyltransferase [Candidatus Saccharimonadia bacterium]|nr:class I SAM-dependent methyltransferase [Candidatus Saccharimonadia bacterium]